MPDAVALDRLFRPRSIAIVGASGNPEKPGFMLVESLKAFAGEIYPINPSATELGGHRAYPTLADVGAPIDLAVIGVPARACPGILAEAAEAGAAAALIISGGFGEAGEAALQDELAGVCKRTGIRLLGPNTVGFMAPPLALSATFMPSTLEIGAGRVGVVAQSGGVNMSFSFALANAGIGVALGVGIGNAVDIGVGDVVAYMAGRDDIDVIAVHLEGISRGRDIYDAIAAATPKKPVVALPVGRTEIGDFAKSHTGNLIGSFALTEAALRQGGMVVVDTITEVVDAVRALADVRLDPMLDAGAGVLTGQAGPGLLIADYLKGRDVTVPDISESTEQTIAGMLPPITYMRNPVDTGRPSPAFPDILSALGNDDAIDAVLVYALYERGTVEPCDVIRQARKTLGKPILYATGGPSADIEHARSGLRAVAVPCFENAHRGAAGLRAVIEDARVQHRLSRRGGSRRKSPEIPKEALDEAAAKEVVDGLGLTTPERRVAADRDEARAAMEALSAPVVVKVLNAAVVHKTEVGGVHLGVGDQSALTAALDAIDAIPGSPHRYLIEETAPAGLELILGGKRDASYGPSVLVGLGGVTAEALGDVAVGLAPLGQDDARAMIDRLQGRALLDGWRGGPAVDLDVLADAIVAIGDLLAANPHVAELDFNPVRGHPGGLSVLDALIVVER